MRRMLLIHTQTSGLVETVAALSATSRRITVITVRQQRATEETEKEEEKEEEKEKEKVMRKKMIPRYSRSHPDLMFLAW